MTVERESKILARLRVAERVEAMLAIVRDRDPNLLERLRLDAIKEMRTWTTVVLKELQQSPKSECNIAGVYLSEAVPPEIGVFVSLSKRRASFTALHEFGHHLQLYPELVDQLGDQPDRGRVLEEMTSDAFAAKVLIPDDLIAKHLGTGTPTARQVVALWQAGAASRAAVCVAAVQRLESPGHVILLDDYGIVDFSASHLEFPLRRGIGQTEAEVMKLWAQTQRSTVEAKSRFSYRDGTKGQELYAQATDMGGYTVVVAVVDKAPWERLALSSREERVLTRWHTCEACEYIFLARERCEICKQPRCPECAWCDCKKLKEKVCVGCDMLKSVHLFADGKDVCRDCA
jgi:Zn-dependent peptidase ImmA (M78 family)